MKVGQRLVLCSTVLFASWLTTNCDGTTTPGTDPDPPTPDPLTVTDVSPRQMKNTGGTPVTITGTGFQNGATVQIAGVSAQDVVVVNSTMIQVKSPLKAATCSKVPIEVKNPDGKTAARDDLVRYLSNGISFATPKPYDMGTYPRQVVAADLNKDGKLDLISVNSGNAGQAVAFRLGVGDGTFGSVSLFTSGNSGFGLAVADLNKDGNLDLATVNNGNTNVTTRLATGPGTFANTTAAFSTGADPRAMAAADVNGDGATDLLVVNYASNNLSVFINLNDGSGAFAAQSTSPIGTGPTQMLLADLDKDGKLDVVATNGSSNAISVRLGQAGGNFANAVSVSVGSNPIYLASGDWNGDGNPDLAVSNGTQMQGTYTVSILLGDGKGAFATPAQLDLGATTTPRGLTASDFDQDGKLDLAVAGFGNNTVAVLPGKGDGTFEPALSVPGPTTPLSIISTDLNGDGFPDVAASTGATASQAVSVMLGQCK